MGIDQVAEIPLVISNDTITTIEKTSAAVKLLKLINAYPDVERVSFTKKLRAGKGKARNRRYVIRRGPLIIYDEKTTICRAFRNLPGVDLCCVTRLNLLQLAPGGHLGRFIIWTQAAFLRLETVYGTYKTKSTLKVNYTIPRPLLTTSNITRIMKSDEIKSVLRWRKKVVKRASHRPNPLTNLGFLVKLNPYAKTTRRKELLLSDRAVRAKVAAYDHSKKARRAIVEKKRAEAGKGKIPPAPRDPKWKLPKNEYLAQKRPKIFEKLKKKQEKYKAKRLARKEAAKKEGGDKKEDKKEGGDKKEDKKNVKKRVARPERRRHLTIPGSPRVNHPRYDPAGLRKFKLLRKRLLKKQIREMNRSILPPRQAGVGAWIEAPGKKRPHLSYEQERKKRAEKRTPRKKTPKKEVKKDDKSEKTEEKSEKTEVKKEKGRPPKSTQNKHVKRFAQLMRT